MKPIDVQGGQIALRSKIFGRYCTGHHVQTLQCKADTVSVNEMFSVKCVSCGESTKDHHGISAERLTLESGLAVHAKACKTKTCCDFLYNEKPISMCRKAEVIQSQTQRTAFMHSRDMQSQALSMYQGWALASEILKLIICHTDGNGKQACQSFKSCNPRALHLYRLGYIPNKNPKDMGYPYLNIQDKWNSKDLETEFKPGGWYKFLASVTEKCSDITWKNAPIEQVPAKDYKLFSSDNGVLGYNRCPLTIPLDDPKRLQKWKFKILTPFLVTQANTFLCALESGVPWSMRKHGQRLDLSSRMLSMMKGLKLPKPSKPLPAVARAPVSGWTYVGCFATSVKKDLTGKNFAKDIPWATKSLQTCAKNPLAEKKLAESVMKGGPGGDGNTFTYTNETDKSLMALPTCQSIPLLSPLANSTKAKDSKVIGKLYQKSCIDWCQNRQVTLPDSKYEVKSSPIAAFTQPISDGSDKKDTETCICPGLDSGQGTLDKGKLCAVSGSYCECVGGVVHFGLPGDWKMKIVTAADGKIKCNEFSFGGPKKHGQKCYCKAIAAEQKGEGFYQYDDNGQVDDTGCRIPCGTGDPGPAYGGGVMSMATRKKWYHTMPQQKAQTDEYMCAQMSTMRVYAQGFWTSNTPTATTKDMINLFLRSKMPRPQRFNTFIPAGVKDNVKTMGASEDSAKDPCTQLTLRDEAAIKFCRRILKGSNLVPHCHVQICRSKGLMSQTDEMSKSIMMKMTTSIGRKKFQKLTGWKLRVEMDKVVLCEMGGEHQGFKTECRSAKMCDPKGVTASDGMYHPLELDKPDAQNRLAQGKIGKASPTPSPQPLNAPSPPEVQLYLKDKPTSGTDSNRAHHPSSLAVDGEIFENPEGRRRRRRRRQCTLTHRHSDPWWAVDLQKTEVITKVLLWTPKHIQMNHVNVYADDKLCGNTGVTKKGSAIVVDCKGKPGKQIKLQGNYRRRGEHLQICEVQIFSIPPAPTPAPYPAPDPKTFKKTMVGDAAKVIRKAAEQVCAIETGFVSDGSSFNTGKVALPGLMIKFKNGKCLQHKDQASHDGAWSTNHVYHYLSHNRKKYAYFKIVSASTCDANSMAQRWTYDEISNKITTIYHGSLTATGSLSWKKEDVATFTVDSAGHAAQLSPAKGKCLFINDEGNLSSGSCKKSQNYMMNVELPGLNVS